MKSKLVTVFLTVVLIFSFSISALSTGISTSISPVLRLGRGSEKSELYLPVIFDEGPDGNIYVFDKKDTFIKVYNSKGDYLCRLGGRGQGPGEILRMGNFGFYDEKTLFITEYINGHRWITLYELPCKYKNVIKLNWSGKYGLYKAKALPGQRIVCEFNADGLGEKLGNYYGIKSIESLTIVNERGEKEGEIIRKNNLIFISSERSAYYQKVPFFPCFLWDTTKDGKIIFSDGSSNILEMYNEEGKCIKKIKTSIPDTEKVTSKDLKEWKEKLKKKFIEGNRKNEYENHYQAIKNLSSSIYKKKPIYEHLSVTPSGNILIREEKNNKDDYKYWLLNEKGEILAEKITKAKMLKITEHFLLFVIEDEDDEVLCYIRRKGNDRNDLTCIK